MIEIIIKIYDYFVRHKNICFISLASITAILIALLFRLDFKEDISAFLPLDDVQQKALSVYQDVSGAGKILAVFQAKDSVVGNPDNIVEAIQNFGCTLQQVDTAMLVRNVISEFDIEKVTAVSDFVYANIPYFLTESDYERIDSLLASPDYIGRQLEYDKQLLMFPTTSLLSENLQKDPLNLFSPVVSKLNRDSNSNIELYDGYIFTSDMCRAIVMMESPFGNSETQNNAILLNTLNQVADSVQVANPEVKLHYIGGPVIAVGNASQIKHDSVLSILIAVILIVALLVLVFRKAWNILLIVLSVGWGWLFAMALLSAIHGSVSLIVVGISSIILGIAVNYPLHLIAHTSHTRSMRQVLREIIVPLVIGNITTVGAFIALLPLKAAALRDLGIFGAFILIGTILFVVIYLPHSVKRSTNPPRVKLLDKISNLTLETRKSIVIAVLILTGVFAYYSTQTNFDANISHINYVTSEQIADMDYFRQFMSNSGSNDKCLYVVSESKEIDKALLENEKIDTCLRQLAIENGGSLSSCCDFLPSQAEQERRIKQWGNFIDRHKNIITSLREHSRSAGFSEDAFIPFFDILNSEYDVKGFSYFEPLATAFSQNLSLDKETETYRVIDELHIPHDKFASAKAQVQETLNNSFCFDVESMNSAMANSLSDNFNYIGFACGLIVFLFLWFSFGSIELALLSFLPMAVSWIWILGIMGMSGLQFNIVNIILATFIFGQGDDYTIFMTEGCCYEYARRKKMLASYKSSIIVSALIMFIGIGTLILAKHPALRSLAQVTIVGMFSVVLMAYLLPPLVFNWMTRINGQYRKRPLSIGPLLRTWFCGAWWLLQLLIGYIVGFILFKVFKRTAKTNELFRKLVCSFHRFDIKLMPGITIKTHNPFNENLEKPCVIVSNHQSMLDPIFFMAWSHKILIVANEHSSLNPIVRIMFRWLGFYTIKQSNFTAWEDSSLDRDMDMFRKYISEGYSITFFPEGMRNANSSVLRCHKGAFYLAQQLGVDILPVLLHGVNNVMPKGSFACYSGNINMHIESRITSESLLWNDNCAIMAKQVRTHLAKEYNILCEKYETCNYFLPLVLDRYRYKGVDSMSEVRRNLKRADNYIKIVDTQQTPIIYVLNSGYGELPLLMALAHPKSKVLAFEKDVEKLEIARIATDGLVCNLEYCELLQYNDSLTINMKVYDAAEFTKSVQ